MVLAEKSGMLLALCSALICCTRIGGKFNKFGRKNEGKVKEQCRMEAYLDFFKSYAALNWGGKMIDCDLENFIRDSIGKKSVLFWCRKTRK